MRRTMENLVARGGKIETFGGFRWAVLQKRHKVDRRPYCNCHQSVALEMEKPRALKLFLKTSGGGATGRYCARWPMLLAKSGHPAQARRVRLHLGPYRPFLLIHRAQANGPADDNSLAGPFCFQSVRPNSCPEAFIQAITAFLRRATTPTEARPRPTSTIELGSGTPEGAGGIDSVAESEMAPVLAGVWVKLTVKLAGAGLGLRMPV